jgi:ATP-dependent Clp protease adaptor protein ClpS
MAPERGKKPAGDRWAQEETAVKTDEETAAKEPNLYNVLLHNDDYTTMEFVVMVLMDVFHHKEEEAIRIMLQVHRQGVGVAGVYSYEIAETKVDKVIQLARKHEFPLRCSMEPL